MTDHQPRLDEPEPPDDWPYRLHGETEAEFVRRILAVTRAKLRATG